MEDDAAHDFRGRICGIIRRVMLPVDNLSKEHRKALKSLKEMEDVVVLPADKGNTTVLMNKKDYCMKIEGMLASDTYDTLKKDPIKTQERKICALLKSLEKRRRNINNPLQQT